MSEKQYTYHYNSALAPEVREPNTPSPLLFVLDALVVVLAVAIIALFVTHYAQCVHIIGVAIAMLH